MYQSMNCTEMYNNQPHTKINFYLSDCAGLLKAERSLLAMLDSKGQDKWGGDRRGSCPRRSVFMRQEGALYRNVQ